MTSSSAVSTNTKDTDRRLMRSLNSAGSLGLSVLVPGCVAQNVVAPGVTTTVPSTGLSTVEMLTSVVPAAVELPNTAVNPELSTRRSLIW